MLNKVVYRQVLKGLENLRKQHDEDRREKPTALPIDWKSCIIRLIEHVARENRTHLPRGQAEETLKYLEKQGLIVPYHGGYTFPGTEIPTREQIQAHAEATLQHLGLSTKQQS